MKRLFFDKNTRQLVETELPDNFCFPNPKSQQPKVPKSLADDEVCCWHPRFGPHKARYSIYKKYDFDRNLELARKGGMKSSLLWGPASKKCTKQRPNS
jgi:hypothetical protein